MVFLVRKVYPRYLLVTLAHDFGLIIGRLELLLRL